MFRCARRTSTLAITFLVVCLLGAVQVDAAPGGDTWTSAGGNRTNTRFAAAEHDISPATVGDLAVKWITATGGDVSATPAVDDEKVYVPDWAGNIYALDRETGGVVWTRTVSSITGIPGDKARATPAISGDVLVLGNQGPFGGGGAVFALNKNTGEIVWLTQVESHLAAIITQSATISDGVVYVGVASQEELLAAFVPGYPCCSFRGSFVALDLATGAMRWKTYMAPEGYSGNAVWGSSPAIDTKRKSVYIATGNNYSVPPSVLDCVATNEGNPTGQEACPAADDYFDRIMALDTRTGAVTWTTRTVPYDAWTADCIPFLGSGDNCPDPAGPQYDFGQAPALFTATAGNGRPVELVGAGQKSGQYWALDPATGAIRWITQSGPGGTDGGLMWGSAVDGTRVYTANANSLQIPWSLPGGPDTTAGIWSALDAVTGQVLWQVTPSLGGSTSGPVTTANGVVFGCSLDPLGHMYALDAATGEELWIYESGGSCLSGAAISKGTVYWGSGYSNRGLGTPNNKLYAFSLG
jgi:polyvinyl alcohol dehydrogenase (cytochrome)